MAQNFFRIKNHVRIKAEKIYFNQNEVFSEDTSTETDFLKQAYQKLNLRYPKFFKMDRLCKLGILATEILFQVQKPNSDTALVFSNATSSLDIDLQHQAAMAGTVSPSIFVYTLPNIVLGEISIRHKLQSENAFFVEERFNANLIFEYSEALLKSGKAAAVVSGWIDLQNDEYDVLLCHVSKEGELPFSEEILEHLYYFKNE